MCAAQTPKPKTQSLEIPRNFDPCELSQRAWIAGGLPACEIESHTCCLYVWRGGVLCLGELNIDRLDALSEVRGLSRYLLYRILQLIQSQ